MQGVNRYKSAQSMSWTHTDMLLLIYDRALQGISLGIQSLESREQKQLAEHRMLAHKALLLIADGLDVTQGDVPQNILRLCIFAIEQTSGTNVEQWKAARSVIHTLREAFADVRDETNQLESTGKIPALAG